MNGNEHKMTVKDVLIDVQRILSDLKIPVKEIETIGLPVSRAVEGIKLCLDAFNKEEMAQQKHDMEQQRDDGDQDEHAARNCRSVPHVELLEGSLVHIGCHQFRSMVRTALGHIPDQIEIPQGSDQRHRAGRFENGS